MRAICWSDEARCRRTMIRSAAVAAAALLACSSLALAQGMTVAPQQAKPQEPGTRPVPRQLQPRTFDGREPSPRSRPAQRYLDPAADAGLARRAQRQEHVRSAESAGHSHPDRRRGQAINKNKHAAHAFWSARQEEGVLLPAPRAASNTTRYWKSGAGHRAEDGLTPWSSIIAARCSMRARSLRRAPTSAASRRTFQVGHVEVPGWNEALQLMKPGAKYRLFIPPQLAYDLSPPMGAPIPPGAMLIFDVNLLSVQQPKPAAPMSPMQMPRPAPPAPGQPRP